MALLLVIMSAILGVGLGLVSVATPVFATHLFTRDADVTAMFMRVAPFMGAGQLLASIVLVAEGVLIGSNPYPARPLYLPLSSVLCLFQ
jgi:Na+-driven multidrug efflux pump